MGLTSQQSTFMQSYNSFANNTSLHGLKHSANPLYSRTKRILWAVCFLGMAALFFYLSIEQFTKYFSYPKATRISIHKEIPLEFPAITICDLNKYQKSLLETMPAMKELVERVFPLTGDINLKALQKSSILGELSEIDVETFEKENTRNITDTILYCNLKNKPKPCEQLFQTVFTPFGGCFNFNSYDYVRKHGVLSIEESGPSGGLLVTLNVNEDEYFNGPSRAAGFKIVLHDPQQSPPVDSEGFVVSPGFESYVSISQIRNRDLPKPYEDSSCFEEKPKLNFFNTYSASECWRDCSATYVMEKCNCTLPGVTPYLKTACDIKEMTVCAFVESGNYYKKKIYNKCDCSPLCKRRSFKFSVSQALYPAKHVLDHLSRYKKSAEFIRNNYLNVRIYYEELTYQFIEQFPSFPIADFGANVGGQLGLCLGASILTLLEFIDFIVQYLTNISSTGGKTVQPNQPKKDQKEEECD